MWVGALDASLLVQMSRDRIPQDDVFGNSVTHEDAHNVGRLQGRLVCVRIATHGTCC